MMPIDRDGGINHSRIQRKFFKMKPRELQPLRQSFNTSQEGSRGNNSPLSDAGLKAGGTGIQVVGRTQKGPSFDIPERYIRIIREIVVRADPGKFAPILCQLVAGVIVQVLDEKLSDSASWLHIDCGWISSKDSNGVFVYEESDRDNALKAWKKEADNRHRLSAAVVGLLTKSHSLPNARRVAKSMVTHCKKTEVVPLMSVNNSCMEELLIALGSAMSLRQAEVYEFLKVAATQQSHPRKAIFEICEEIHSMVGMRPSLWVKKDLTVLTTDRVRRGNDQFVMTAARGDVAGIVAALERGQEVSAIHSELLYTALHAATEFGKIETVKTLIHIGMSVNIRDMRYGKSPLHIAAQGGRAEIATFLLDHGGDRTLKSAAGLVPYEIADEHGHYECREVLKFSPPEIQSIQVQLFTSRSITLTWTPPTINDAVHSRVIEYLVEWIPIGYPSNPQPIGNKFRTTETSYTVVNLTPSTGHGFLLYSRSLSGWSKPSGKKIQFTLPSFPDQMLHPEINRIYTNGMFLTFAALEYDNGGKIDSYQIEIMDEDIVRELELSRQAKKSFRLQALAAGSFDSMATDTFEGFSDENSLNSLEEEEEEEDPIEEMSILEDSDNFNHSSSMAVTKYVKQPDDPFSMNSTFNESDLFSNADVKKLSVAPESVDSPGPGPNGFYSHMLHRLIKHTNIHELSKQVTGLEPYRSYLCRIRCHNYHGYGPWSDWTPAVRPGAGVRVIEFIPAEASVTFEWFVPILHTMRTITAYEIQLCHLLGPVYKEIKLLTKEKNNFCPADQHALEFFTLSDAVSVNRYRVDGLQPGGKYKCRVRAQVDGVWNDWKLSFQSDVVTMPASLPEAPFNIQAAILSSEQQAMNNEQLHAENSQEVSGGEDLSLIHSAESIMRLTNNNMTTSSTAATATVSGVTPTEEILTGYDIQHDKIVISWSNGLANASPVIQFQVVMAKVRDYRIQDLNQATAGMLHQEQQLSISDQEEVNVNVNVNAELNDDLSNKKDDDDRKWKRLQWFDITSTGEFMGPQAFRAKKLLPGSSYIFRVRQRNAIGWSPFSRASSLIRTFPSVPPEKPSLSRFGAHFAVISWSEGGQGNGLMNLEYDIQIGVLDKSCEQVFEEGDVDRIAQLDQMAVVWKPAEARTVASESVHEEGEGIIPVVTGSRVAASCTCTSIEEESSSRDDAKKKKMHVLLDRLTAGMVYVVRVRVRTIAGWSTWSQISSPFRTQSNA